MDAHMNFPFIRKGNLRNSTGRYFIISKYHNSRCKNITLLGTLTNVENTEHQKQDNDEQCNNTGDYNGCDDSR